MIYIITCILSFFITWLVIQLAIRKSIFDIPNDRSSHTVPTPRGGGIAVSITWFAGLIFLYRANDISSSLFYALLCGLPISIIGLIDDIFNISAKARFLIQIVAALSATIILHVDSLDLGFYTISSTFVISIISIIGVVWFTNIFNFLDGIDGYIGTEVLFVGLSAFIFWGSNPPLLLASATLGFLLWNWQPAKIFMGDVGSTLLGFSIAVMAISYQYAEASSIIVWLILTSIFWFDATITLIRRILNSEQITSAHRKHAYQRIVQVGFSHQKTVLWSIFLNGIGFGLALLANNFKKYGLCFLIIDLAFLYTIVRYIDKKNPFRYN
jgi:Fuc2NAc and GlcNAc transferase